MSSLINILQKKMPDLVDTLDVYRQGNVKRQVHEMDDMIKKLEQLSESEREATIEKIRLISSLYMKSFNNLIVRFFDFDSLELLDEKIEVLTALSDGKPPKDIPTFRKILELYPEAGVWWDLFISLIYTKNEALIVSKLRFFITSYNFKFRLSEFTVTKLNYSHIISSSVRNKH